jgi:Cof subfamily protein (haloacid dehalogenase superfamily)
VISRHLIAPDVAKAAVAAIEKAGADPWVFSGDDWCVRNRDHPRVALEQRTVGFAPKVVDDFSAVIGSAAKIVAVSNDSSRLTRLQDEVRGTLSHGANIARSQSYYLDFTHPLANKGHAMQELAKLIGVPPLQVAVLGDGENDVAMFDKAGLSIAMGNGLAEVQQAAHFVTGRNDEDGFAAAIDWFVLGGKRTALKDVA